MNILAVDPGTRHLGYAGVTVEGDVLCAGALTLPKELRADYDLSAVVDWYASKLDPVLAQEWDELYVEGMYAGGRGNPDDLLAIQAVGAFLAGRSGTERCFWVTPQQWKGGTPKRVQHAAMAEYMKGAGTWEYLLRALARSGTSATDFEHAYDAMGIALSVTGLHGNQVAMAGWRALRARSPLPSMIPPRRQPEQLTKGRSTKPAFVKKALARAAKKK